MPHNSDELLEETPLVAPHTRIILGFVFRNADKLGNCT